MESRIEWITEENPPKDGIYLVTTRTGLVRACRYYRYLDLWAESYTVIAWAYMPEGYRENDI